MQIYNIATKETLEKYYDKCLDEPATIEDYDINNLDQTKYKWLVAEYYYGSYCGGGEALALTQDNKLALFNLAHCSCYGPLDGGFNNSPHSSEVYSIDDIYGDTVLKREISQALLDKVKELLQLEGLLV